MVSAMISIYIALTVSKDFMSEKGVNQIVYHQVPESHSPPAPTLALAFGRG